MRRLVFALTFGCAASLAAQEASPYVPINHWSMPYVEHLIASGRMADPSPLSRPLKVDELLRTLAAVDSTIVNGSEWAVIKTIRSEFTRKMRGPSARIDIDAGIAGSSHARRDPLREAGVGHATFNGGAALTLYFGPAVVSTHPYFDTRLKWDPDYYGKKDRVIAGRFAEAYVRRVATRSCSSAVSIATGDRASPRGSSSHRVPTATTSSISGSAPMASTSKASSRSSMTSPTRAASPRRGTSSRIGS
jgi:hypothetical protein